MIRRQLGAPLGHRHNEQRDSAGRRPRPRSSCSPSAFSLFSGSRPLCLGGLCLEKEGSSRVYPSHVKNAESVKETRVRKRARMPEVRNRANLRASACSCVKERRASVRPRKASTRVRQLRRTPPSHCSQQLWSTASPRPLHPRRPLRCSAQVAPARQATPMNRHRHRHRHRLTHTHTHT